MNLICVGTNMDGQDRQDLDLGKSIENPWHPEYPCKQMNMDGQDGQDKKRHMEFEDVSRQVIGCAFDVINELGSGFLESVYEKAMCIALQEVGLQVESQKQIDVIFRSRNVGIFYADLFVEQKMIVELKAVKSILPEHEAQVINYLNATGVRVGLLINFGQPKLEFKRFSRKK